MLSPVLLMIRSGSCVSSLDRILYVRNARPVHFVTVLEVFSANYCELGDFFAFEGLSEIEILALSDRVHSARKWR